MCYDATMKEFCIENIDEIACDILASIEPKKENATVITLRGDLGAGKTTLTQAIGKALGIKETMVSPTFVIMKNYPLLGQKFMSLVHIDAYRLDKPEELSRLRFDEYLDDPGNLIVVEWPERVATVLPKEVISYTIEHVDSDKRKISKE